MKYAAFTSMNEKYYDHCGRTMLRSYKQYWSQKFPLYVYNEDNFSVKVNSIKTLGWDLGDEYKRFQQRHNNEKVKTFAKKGFSIIHAMNNLKYDRIIWLDADTVISNDIPMELLNLISPDDVLSTHFSVWHQKDDINYHSCETGFFILNCKHSHYQDFCETYRDIYVNDKCNDLRRFYDGEVYGKTVEIMQSRKCNMLNLNPNRYKTPISRSIITPYISHFKAGLKDKIDFDKLNNNDEV